MNTRPRSHISTLIALAALPLLAIALPSLAQDDEDIQQTVARIAFLEGSASFNRGDDPDNWQEATVNFPMTLGDRLYTSHDGRMELETSGTHIFLGPETELAALDFRDDIRQLSVSIGTASFRINRLSQGEVFEVDTPNVSLTFRRPGYYRVNVDQDGNTMASVVKGDAVAVAGGGEVDLQAGDAIRVDGLERPEYDVVSLPRSDSFDRWVEERSRRFRENISVRYASSDIVGLEDLDQEGRWEQIPDYGWVWGPPAVVGWAPYRDGRWMWQDPWGWTWISHERWGWAPYHYGSWITRNDRWFWVPVPRSVSVVRYAPARVVFTGGGSSGFVGWFPIGPRDPFSPWWGRRAGINVNVTNVTYVNRTRVTVVNRETFTGGGQVQRGFVRDPAVLRQVAAAPVLRGPIPIIPTTASVRIAPGPGSVAVIRPPQVLASRPVVTRVAPPPPLPTFQAKMGLIRENGGMPVTRVRAEKLATEAPRAAKPIIVSRPAIPEGGKVVLTPRRDSVETRPVKAAVPPERRTEAGPAPQVIDKRAVERPPQQRVIQPPPERKAVERPPEQRVIQPPPERKAVERPPEQRVIQPPPERKAVERPPQPRVIQPPPEQRVIQPPPERKAVERPPEQRVIQPPPERKRPEPPPRVEQKAPPAPKVEKKAPPPKKDDNPDKKEPKKDR